MKLKNYYKEVSLLKISIVNFLGGLIIGFPFLIATIYFFGNSKITGISLMLLCIFTIIVFNVLLNKFTKNRNSKYNEYITMFASFIFLFLGVFLSTSVVSTFMSITM